MAAKLGCQEALILIHDQPLNVLAKIALRI